MVRRHDAGFLRSPKKLPDGRWRFDGRPTRSGVFEYVETDGSVRREYRPPEEVFKADSLTSLEGVVITDGHPPSMININNLSQHRIGMVGDSVRRDGDHVVATMFFDSRPRRDQLSCGYDCEIEKSSGVTPSGDIYDVIQRNIVYNHLAANIFAGRARSATLRMDSACMRELMTKKKDQVDPKDAGALAQALSEAEAKNKLLSTKLTEAESRADAAEGQVGGLQKEIESLRSKREDVDEIADLRVRLDDATTRADEAERLAARLPDLISEGVMRRTAIISSAITILGDKDDNGKSRRFDGSSDREIQEAVIGKLHGDVDLSDKTDDYVKGRFDTAVSSFNAGSSALRRIENDKKLAEAKRRRNDEIAEKNSVKIVTTADLWKQDLPSSRMKL